MFVHKMQNRRSTVNFRSTWAPWRTKLSHAIESKTAEFSIGFLIFVNSFFVILDTDIRATEDGETPIWLEYCVYIFMFVYVADLTLRLTVFRLDFFNSYWNIFDFVVVMVDVLFEVLSMMGIGISVSVSVLRILRLGRLVRFMRVLRFFHELYVMFHLMMSALRAISWGAALMAVMMTIWSIIAVEVLHPLNKSIAETTDAYADCERCARAFSSVMNSNLTFFQTIIAGDSWGLVNVTMIEYYPWTALILVTVILSINLGLMNLVVTVIVDKAQEAREESLETRMAEKRAQFEKAKSNMKEMCRCLDSDESGTLSFDEIAEGFHEFAPFRETLMLMDVCERDMQVVFNIMDEDGSGNVSYDEFVEQLYKMKTQDTHTVLVFIKAYVNEIRVKVSEQLELMRNNLATKMLSIDERMLKLDSTMTWMSTALDYVPSSPPIPTELPPLGGAGESGFPQKPGRQVDVRSETIIPRVLPHVPPTSGTTHPALAEARRLPEGLAADYTTVLYKLHRQVEEQLALERRNSEILAQLARVTNLPDFVAAATQIPAPTPPQPTSPNSWSAARPQMPTPRSQWFRCPPLPDPEVSCCVTKPSDIVRVSRSSIS